MNERCPLAEYAPGDKFSDLVLAIRSVRGATDKNGRLYGDVRVGDWSGSKSAKLWQVTEAEINALSKASFLKLSGEVDDSERFAGDLCIKKYAIAAAPEDVTPFLELPRPNNREYQKRFTDLVKSVTDPELHAILRQMFGDTDYRRRFFRAFAAGSVHHAFAGGLLEHTVEVAELCASACTILTGLDRDLLVSSALLHDIGKMEEMDQELRAGEYTDDGCLIGHLVLASVRIAQAVDRFNESCDPEAEISASTRRAVMHLVLSHHGLPEHGAARKPAFAEAAVLYLCDNISAKARQHLDLLAANGAGATSAYNRFLDVQAYLRSPRETTGAASAPGAQPDFFTLDQDRHTTFVTSVVLPVLGAVAAGSPDEKADPTPSEFRRVVPPPAGADFLLHVVGDSMIDASIHEGDLVFVRRQESARDGDIVVAHIAGEGQTVKRFRVDSDSACFLEAANSSGKYPPIPLADDARIQGRVTGLLRDF